MIYKTIDLFSGAGGFSLGFEMVGFHTILALDKWDDAINTFNFNRNHAPGISMDINDFSNERLIELCKEHEIDGIIGGPPCQGFSMVGTRDENDNRNSLYLQYVRFTEIVKPKFFVLENVKGLLTLKQGAYKDDILSRFSDLGYNVNYKVLKASYYGVPQIRERVFFVGLRKDIFDDQFFIFPEPNQNKIISTYDALSDLPSLDNGQCETKYLSEPLNEFQRLMRKQSKVVLNNDITNHTDKTKEIIAIVPDGGSIKDLPEEYRNVRNFKSAFKRMNSKRPSSTIDCGHRNYFHYRENRIPTVRESARIQSFPDHYFFTGSKTSQYTQVGNAVPSLLAKELAINIKKILDEKMTSLSNSVAD